MARRPRWRRIARAVGIGAAALVVLAVAALVFVHTPWGKELVRRRIERALAERVDGTVRVGDLDYTFLFGSIHLGDVEILDAHGRPAIRVASLDADLDRASLLAGEPEIGELVVRGLAVTAAVGEDGRSTLDDLFRKADDAPLARVRIAHFVVGGRIDAVTPRATIAIAEIDIAGTLDARPAAQQLELALAHVTSSITVAPVGRPPMRADVRLGPATVSRRGGVADVHVDGVAAGPLSLASITAHLGDGDPRAAARGGRIDRAQLAALLGRETLTGDVAFEAALTGRALTGSLRSLLAGGVSVEAALAGTLDAPTLAGSVRSGPSLVKVTGSVDLTGARPSYRVVVAGEDVRAADVAAAAAGREAQVIRSMVATGLFPPVAGTFRIEVAGSGTTPEDLDANVTVAVRALAVELTGRAALAPGRAVRGSLRVALSPPAALRELEEVGYVVPRDAARIGARIPTIDATVAVEGRTDGELVATLAPTSLSLAGGRVGLEGRAVLADGRLRTATGRISLAGLDLASLAYLAGRPPQLRGSLSGTLALRDRAVDYDLALALASGIMSPARTGSVALASPSGSVALAPVASPSGSLAPASSASPALAVSLRGRADAARVAGRAIVARGATRVATIDAAIALADGEVRRDAPWRLVIEAGASTADLPAELRGGVELPPGRFDLRGVVAGTPARPTGAFTIVAGDGVRRADMRATLAPTASGFSLATSTAITHAGAKLAAIEATLALPPLARMDRAAREATIAGTVDVPARTAAELAALHPRLAALAELPGAIAGRIAVRGPVRDPALDAAFHWDGYTTVAGAPGRTELVVTGDARVVNVRLVHGAAAASDQTIVLAARIDRTAADRIAVDASVRAADVPLPALLPASLAVRVPTGVEPGMLRSDLAARFTVRGGAIEELTTTGALALSGASLAIPDSDRRLRDISLSLAPDPRGLRITAEAHERDLAVRDRSLAASGLLTFADRRPAVAIVDITARDWLVFGGAMGAAAAPRATLDLELGLAVDLAAPILGIDATIRALTLNSPDRGELVLEREPTSGDLVYLAPGQPAGTFAVAPPPAPASASSAPPMDLRIHIPNPVRLINGALDVAMHGDLAVRVRDDGVATTGRIELDRGVLSFFGQSFVLLAGGNLVFSPAHPAGHATLAFERHLPDATVRELADSLPARVELNGPLSDLKLSFHGATNISFTDVVAVNNIGRAHTVARPGFAVSQSAHAPRGTPLLMTAWFAMLAPDLLFLDRIAAWSDPADGRYSKVERVEGDLYLGRDRVRIRAVVRPPTAGRSSNEVHVDRVLVHDDRTAAGIGVRAGDRGGGGLGFFFEWSSSR